MTNSGCRAAIQEFFRPASCLNRWTSSSSAQTIRCFPEGVRRAVDPALLDPVVDLLGDDTQLLGQVGDPPLVLTDEIVAEQFPDEAEITDQRLRSWPP